MSHPIPDENRHQWPAGMEAQCEEIYLRNERDTNTAKMMRDMAKRIAALTAELREAQADAYNLKSHVHTLCNENIKDTLAAALEQTIRADKAEAELREAKQECERLKAPVTVKEWNSLGLSAQQGASIDALLASRKAAPKEPA